MAVRHCKRDFANKGDVDGIPESKKPGASSAPGTPPHHDNYQLPKIGKIVKRCRKELRGIEGGFDSVVKEVLTLHRVPLDREQSEGFVACCSAARQRIGRVEPARVPFGCNVMLRPESHLAA